MILKIADNITSPLGGTTRENYEAVLKGRSCLRLYEGRWGVPEPFMASLFADDDIDSRFAALSSDKGRYSRFEKVCILSIADALNAAPHVDISSPRTLLIVSTTKGNVEQLGQTPVPESVLLATAAQNIGSYFGKKAGTTVVSNACISGVCAQIVAHRALESGRYDNAVVAGADVQSRFIISGFQSFKALSQQECKPFDAERKGLNLGEAAATIIYGRSDGELDSSTWHAVRGAIRNDANHISGPSRTGEGCFRAMRACIKDFDTRRIGLVNAHGTATLYNDEMEAIAIDRMGLSQTPVNTFKGYYGHTMGAAGVLETILSMWSLDHGKILPTRGYHTHGVSAPINVTSQLTHTTADAFIKIMSGFGGCNAAMLFTKGGAR